MRRLFSVFLTVGVLVLPIVLIAQNIPAKAPALNDDMPFMLILGVGFLSIVLGGVIIGSFLASLVLFALFTGVSAGILSASLLIGFYKRSFAEGFRALLVTTCGLGASLAGIPAFLLINHFFKLHVSRIAAAGWGAVAGLAGGLLLGVSLFILIRSLMAYFKQRLAF